MVPDNTAPPPALPPAAHETAGGPGDHRHLAAPLPLSAARRQGAWS